MMDRATHQLCPQYPHTFPASIESLELPGPPTRDDGQDKEEREEWREDGPFLET